MNEQPTDTTRTVKKAGPRAVSRRLILALAGALVVVLALAVGLNVGGVRERLFGGIGTPRIGAIAVLPFANLTRDPAQEYFAEGMMQVLVGNLQPIAAVRVIAPPSLARYRKAPKPLVEIARELGLDAIVEGSVLRSGDRVQLTVSLVHAPTNRRLWGQTYERDQSDALILLADVARAIAHQIGVPLTPQADAFLSGTRALHPEALDAGLRGMFGGNPAKTEEYLKQAVQLDPTSPWPSNVLGNFYYMRNMYPAFAPGDTYPRAKEAAQKALSLDPTLSVSHRILASVAFEYDWDFGRAEEEFKRAVEFSANGLWAHHMYAHFLLAMGRMEEARVETRRVVELDPLGSATIACVSWHDIAERNFDEAEKRASLALSLGAPDQLARLTLGWSYGERQRFDEAIPEFQKAVVGWQAAVFPTAALGHSYAVAGKEPVAREVLDKLLARATTEYVSPYEIAVIYAGLGDRDRAFEWLEKAYAERSSFLVYFRMDPRIWSLRSDPRFKDLLRRMSFPEDRLN